MFPEQVENSFGNLSVEVLLIVKNSFARSLEIKRKRNFPKKLFFMQLYSLNAQKAVWQLYGIFICQKSETLSPPVRLFSKNIRKIEKICSVNWFSEQVEISFENFPVKCLLNVRKRFNQKPKKSSFSCNCTPWTRRKQFDIFTGILFAKSEKHFRPKSDYVTKTLEKSKKSCFV